MDSDSCASWLDIYRCPTCRGELSKSSQSWLCLDCGRNYPLREGVPLLAERAISMPGFLGSVEEPTAFLDLAKRQGWMTALRGRQQAGEPDRLRDALAPNRISWAGLMDIGPDSIAVDIGAGTGGVACQLAAQCHVIAIDRSYPESAFIAERARQSDLANLDSIVADSMALPIAPTSVDVVTLIGVLEWVPADTPDRDPRSSQLQALKEVRRILKPGGCLYLGIENRYYLGYFLGVAEPHARLRYLSLMDEKSANQYSQEVRGKPYLELTHSLTDYLSLLREAGFAAIEPYWLFPDYRLTTHFIPLDDSAPLGWFREQMLDPRGFHGSLQQSVYNYYRFAAPELVRQSVRDYGFVAYAGEK
jgi:SAM-dependent methyltransferase/uncharacterized protein YbaR (Trm112 family)